MDKSLESMRPSQAISADGLKNEQLAYYALKEQLVRTRELSEELLQAANGRRTPKSLPNQLSSVSRYRNSREYGSSIRSKSDWHSAHDICEYLSEQSAREVAVDKSLESRTRRLIHNASILNTQFESRFEGLSWVVGSCFIAGGDWRIACETRNRWSSVICEGLHVDVEYHGIADMDAKFELPMRVHGLALPQLLKAELGLTIHEEQGAISAIESLLVTPETQDFDEWKTQRDRALTLDPEWFQSQRVVHRVVGNEVVDCWTGRRMKKAQDAENRSACTLDLLEWPLELMQTSRTQPGFQLPPSNATANAV